MVDATERQRLAFVVGTGRCGSTALSSVLNVHPEVLSLSELFTALGDDAIPDESLSGARFWRIVAGSNPVFDVMIRSNVEPSELLYPRSPGRFSAESTGIPAPLLTTLPHLTDHPDDVFDEMAAVVPRWPTRSAAEQYEALFAWMSDRFGGRVAVERSGYSLHRVPLFRERFPHARFVHLYRDGPDCALSMSKHSGLRVILLRHRVLDRLGLRSLAEITPEHLDALPPELAGIFADRFDPAVVRQPLPLEEFGELWSRTIETGLVGLAAVPESKRLMVRYEDILDDPEAEMTRLAAFLGIEPSREWLDSACRLFDASRRGSAQELPAEQFARLRDRCVPGTRALAEFTGRQH